jgi:hypothetical protein
MKKILLLSFFSLSFIPAFSQLEKGTKLIGVGFGSFGFTNNKNNTSYTNTPTVNKSDGNSYSFSIFPNVAWFVMDDLAIGGVLSLSLNGGKTTNSNTSSTVKHYDEYSQPSFYIGPYVRYYFYGNSKGRIFSQLSAQYGVTGGKTKYTSNNSVPNSETAIKPMGDVSVGLSGGFEYFVNSTLGLYATVGAHYDYSKTEYQYKPSSGTGYKYSYEETKFRVPLNIGLQIHLLPKRK